MDIESIAERAYRAIIDPASPANHLRRPARRTCLYCGQAYRSTVSILIDPGFCSDGCAVDAHLLACQVLDRVPIV